MENNQQRGRLENVFCNRQFFAVAIHTGRIRHAAGFPTMENYTATTRLFDEVELQRPQLQFSPERDEL